jgi:hypothetical protein
MLKRRTPKLVLAADNTCGMGLKRLADKLSEKVGYRVLRVLPDRIRNRPHFRFHRGIDKVEQFRQFSLVDGLAPKHSRNVDGIDSFGFKRVVARTLTNSSEGQGIVIFEKGETPPPAPLYVEYIPKKKEYRVHVFNNAVIDIAEKRKKRGYDGERESLVRNTANGYVFCRTDVVEPSDLRTCALRAVASLGRSYGAADVIWNEKLNKCFVLEVNSRPGMEGTTVEKYAEAILASTGVKHV